MLLGNHGVENMRAVAKAASAVRFTPPQDATGQAVCQKGPQSFGGLYPGRGVSGFAVQE
jgi:hypothetical protein